MVGHQTETVNPGSIPFSGRFQIADKSFVIRFLSKDRASFVSTGSDMIKSMRVFNPKGPSHKE